MVASGTCLAVTFWSCQRKLGNFWSVLKAGSCWERKDELAKILKYPSLRRETRLSLFLVKTTKSFVEINLNLIKTGSVSVTRYWHIANIHLELSVSRDKTSFVKKDRKVFPGSHRSQLTWRTVANGNLYVAVEYLVAGSDIKWTKTSSSFNTF